MSTDAEVERIIALHDLISDVQKEMLSGHGRIVAAVDSLTRRVGEQNGRIAGLEEWRGSHTTWTTQALHLQEVEQARVKVAAEALLTRRQVKVGIGVTGALIALGAGAMGLGDQMVRHWHHIVWWR